MYSITITRNFETDNEGFRFISETIYNFHPSVKSIQLWVKSKRDENGVLTRLNSFRVSYRDGSFALVPWKNYAPMYYQDRICVSYDGKKIFIPDYEKGIFVVEIATALTTNQYKIRHIFSIWVTGNSLLCLHKEGKRTLVRLNLKTGTVEEEKRSNGLAIVPLSAHCILYKKDSDCYVFANSDNLSECLEKPVIEWLGFTDDNFYISQASLKLDNIVADCFLTDSENNSKIIRKRMMLSFSGDVREFFKSLENNT